ncbi:MAG: sigma-54 dependent transcriptional regulator [Sphaerochaetaceae bacterium]|jgi:two-component system response regulator AtoC|nr:sigma-54 dependent transcriptional regulator [Sphaerochaetaceae bacterium]MDC7237663.1 sigma-54 dependent transcriptional regulator [Sphaerochaetaceae bacterium]MDC7250567.1 sigma-54 dependent transcriptional regulator [Sphaerochaetaceae bacterium]
MKVLIVDDEINIRTSLSQFFSVYDIDSELAENGLVAQRLLFSDSFDAMVVDLKMPGMDGLELIKWMREEGFDIPVIMVSAHGEISDAVSALKGGAADYIVKPFNPEELVNKIQKMVEANKVKQLVENPPFENSSFIGQSAQMLDIKKTIARCAKTRSNVLITGESGTGKGVVAKEIHRQSFGEDGPFQSINIGGVPASLIESELFGHEKGAFTGAVSRKLGLFEVANGGTLFLDELGDLPLDLQVKLLTVINDKQVQRLGDTQKRDINVRIIAATNKNLEKMVNEGTFREDLYFRLNVLRIKLPPLRERKDDIPLLAAGILKRLKREMGNEMLSGFTPNALEKLKNGQYYGNVRELENVIERAILFCDDTLIHEDDITIEDNVGMAISQPSSPTSKSSIEVKSLKEVEKEKIIESLHRWAGNKTKASKELGISRRTLLNKISEYDIDEYKKVK